MTIEDLFNECAEVTKSKGFDVSQHATQILLLITEIQEALENLSPAFNFLTDSFKNRIVTISKKYEDYRSRAVTHKDTSEILNKDAYLEELADIQIRLASYIAGNGFTVEFIHALVKKIGANKNRPVKHGKGF